MDEFERLLEEARPLASVSTFDQWLRMLETGLTRLPREPRLLNQLAYAYMQAGDWQKALDHSSNAIRLDADYIDALYNIGRCHLYRGDLKRAKESFHAALRHAPTDPEIVGNLGVIEAERCLRSSPRASLETALEFQRRWGALHPRFRFDEDDLLFKLAVDLKRQNKFALAQVCLERMQDAAYPDRSRNLAMLNDLLELAREVDALTHDPSGTMRLSSFLDGAAPILGSLDRIRNAPDETWMRLAYYVVEVSIEHFVLFEQLDRYLQEGRLPPVLPQHEGAHWSPMIHLATGILHDLLTHFGSPTRLCSGLREQPVWGKVQNLKYLRLLRVLIAASGHRLTSVSLHGALGVISKAPENVIGRYLTNLADLVTRYWHEWGATPAFEGRDFG